MLNQGWRRICGIVGRADGVLTRIEEISDVASVKYERGSQALVSKCLGMCERHERNAPSDKWLGKSKSPLSIFSFMTCSSSSSNGSVPQSKA